MTWRQFILALGLYTKEEMAEAGFGAYWQGSERVIPDKGDLRDYWINISSDKDFLGTAPSYVFIQDPMRRLCHRMIACSIFGRGQAPEKYLFRHVKGRKSGAKLSGGHFIGCLAAHFGLVSDQGLRSLLVVTCRSSTYIGTSAIGTFPQDYTIEDFQVQGGGQVRYLDGQLHDSADGCQRSHLPGL
nr:hypothetical protein [Tanacetum cinerariifolium]